MPTRTKTTRTTPTAEKTTGNTISTETKLMQSVSAMFDYTSTHLRNQIAEANRRKMIAGTTLDKNQMESLSNLIDTCLKEAFVRSSGELVGVINALEL